MLLLRINEKREPAFLPKYIRLFPGDEWISVLWLFAFLFLMTKGKVRKWLLLFLHYFDSLLFSDVLQLDFLGNLIKWTNQIQICFTIYIAVYTAWIMQVPYSHILMHIHAESWIVYKETFLRLIKIISGF